ncbi:MAG: hypothetical protein K8T10_00545 [Candidatus Eremiobacteraeota bacterium]|nr:hypothetical protein [Candidatus Eremiobacteraeota bacterium]
MGSGDGDEVKVGVGDGESVPVGVGDGEPVGVGVTGVVVGVCDIVGVGDEWEEDDELLHPTIPTKNIKRIVNAVDSDARKDIAGHSFLICKI